MLVPVPLDRFEEMLYSHSAAMLQPYLEWKKMATQNGVKVSSAEKQVVLDALDMYVKSLERAERAAKDVAIASAYRDAAGKVRALSSKLMSGELEF